jgi:predicted GNAT family acetyltransferase
MTNGPSAHRIWDDEDNHRYVIEVDDATAGLAVYHLRGGRHIFVHTEISKEFGGQGLGRDLVKFALDDVRSKGGLVVPICPFFAAYLERHPEYEDLVDRELLDSINNSPYG